MRIGILGAAKIAPPAVIKPAREVDGVEVVAVAARDRERARAFASRHGIPTVHESYDALLADADVDAVYNPLPNGLHGPWTLRAIEAGKHVLCEKPFASNAEEAASVRAAAEAAPGLVVVEAFHWRHHPLAARMIEIGQGGELGEVRHVEAAFCFPLFSRTDIRWQLDLAGGALMDAGCYAIHMVRTMAGDEPEVVSAVARLRSPGVDRMARAELRFADGRTGRITASMWSSSVLRLFVRVVGTAATMHVTNPLAPHLFHRLRVGRRRERVPGRTTYPHQLTDFRDAVAGVRPPVVTLDDSVANMRVIDDVYRAAGLEPRPIARL